MDVHRLHVVKFDKRISEESNANGKLIDGEKDPNHDNIDTEVDKQKQTAHRKSECTNVITKTPSSKHIRSFNKHKSKSEVLRVPPKRKKLKKHIRKTLSFNKLKRSFSLRHNICSAWSRQSIHKRKTRRQGTRTVKKYPNHKKDIVVLFANDPSKITEKPRNCSPKRYNRKIGEINSSYDVFGFRKSNRGFFPNILSRGRSNNDINETQTHQVKNRKRKKQSKTSKTQTVWTCIRSRNYHHPLKLLSSRKLRKSKSGLSFCRCLFPKHYNLVDFPDYSKTKMSACNTVRLYQIDSWTNDSGDVSCQCKDEQVSVTPSRLQVPTTCFGDAAVATSKITCECDKTELPASTSKTKACECKTSTKKLQTTSSARSSKYKNMFSQEILSRLMPCSTAYSNKCHTPGKTVVKYILLGIIIAVWSPCIIAVGLCWLITYPLRPHHTVIKTDESEFQQYHSRYPCECGNSKQTCLSKIFNWGTRLLSKSAYFGKAIKSLIQSSKEKLNSSHAPMPCSPCHTIRHPDPNKRYNLFYANNRGWLMKPIRNRIKSKRNNYFVHKIYNLLCGNHGPKINTVNVLSGCIPNKKAKKKSSLKEKRECSCRSHSIDKRVTIEESRVKSEKKKLKDNLSHKSNVKLTQPQPCPPCPPCPSLYQRTPQMFLPMSNQNPPPSHPTYHRRVQPSKHIVTHRNTPPTNPLSGPCVSSKSLRRSQSQHQTQTPASTRQCLEYCAQGAVQPVQQFPKRFRGALRKKHPCHEKKSQRKFNPQTVGFMKFRANNKCYKKPSKSFGKRVYCQCKATYRKAKDILNEADADIWSDDIGCHDMYVHTLKRKPWFWLHGCCPSLYPCFLTWHKCSENTCRMFVYILSVCVWCPIICWCYLVYELFCQCLK